MLQYGNKFLLTPEKNLFNQLYCNDFPFIKIFTLPKYSQRLQNRRKESYLVRLKCLLSLLHTIYCSYNIISLYKIDIQIKHVDTPTLPITAKS